MTYCFFPLFSKDFLNCIQNHNLYRSYNFKCHHRLLGQIGKKQDASILAYWHPISYLSKLFCFSKACYGVQRPDPLRFEQGNRFVPDYEVAILSEYFNISSDELLGKEEPGQ